MSEPNIKQLRYVFRLHHAIKLVWDTGRLLTALALCLRVVQGVLPLAILYLTKLIVDAATGGADITDKSSALSRLNILIILTGVVVLIQAVARGIAEYVREAHSQKLTDHVQNVIQTKSIELDLGFYENPKYYDTLHRAQREGTFRPQRILRGLTGLAQNGISLGAVTGLLLSFSPLITLILFISAVPGVLLRVRYTNRYYQWQNKRTEDQRRTTYFHQLLTDLTFAKEVRLFDIGIKVRDWYQNLRNVLRGEYLGIILQRIRGEFVVQAGAAIAVFGSLLYIARQTVLGMISVGDMVMYFLAFQRGLSYMQQFMGVLAGLYEDNLFLAHLEEFLGLERMVPVPAKSVPVPQLNKKGLVLKNVSFSYPGTEKQALTNLSFSIMPNETVAFVGENGSGKSTLVKLLCRFYKSDDGTIEVEDFDLMDIHPKDWRRNVRVIFQDFSRYNLSANENIWIGDHSVDRDDDIIKRAAKNAGIDHVLSNLPNGYENILGKMFEGGNELSIGEWQKIALARAFLLDTQVLILDEPTSGLDAEAEADLFDKFANLAQEKIAIIISHRFSTVSKADRIFVLDQGELIESGTHQELINLNGKYARMYSIQANLYQ